MLAPMPPPHTITHSQSQSRPLRETLLLGLMVIGMMIVGGVFLYFVTDVLLWLEEYVRDQFMNAGSIIGQAAQQRWGAADCGQRTCGGGHETVDLFFGDSNQFEW